MNTIIPPRLLCCRLSGHLFCCTHNIASNSIPPLPLYSPLVSPPSLPSVLYWVNFFSNLSFTLCYSYSVLYFVILLPFPPSMLSSSPSGCQPLPFLYFSSSPLPARLIYFSLRLLPMFHSLSCLKLSSFLSLFTLLSSYLHSLLPRPSLQLSLTLLSPPVSISLTASTSLPLWKKLITPNAAQSLRVILFFSPYRCNMTPPLIPTQQPPHQLKWLLFCAAHPIRLE